MVLAPWWAHVVSGPNLICIASSFPMLGLTAVEDMLAELVVLHRGAESSCVIILGEVISFVRLCDVRKSSKARTIVPPCSNYN